MTSLASALAVLVLVLVLVLAVFGLSLFPSPCPRLGDCACGAAVDCDNPNCLKSAYFCAGLGGVSTHHSHIRGGACLPHSGGGAWVNCSFVSSSCCCRSPLSASPSHPGRCVSWAASCAHSHVISSPYSAKCSLKSSFLFLFQRLLCCNQSFLTFVPWLLRLPNVFFLPYIFPSFF